MDYNNGRRVGKGHASHIASAYYPNMDLMRYVLAIAVVIAHIDYLTGYDLSFPLSSFEAVGGFFAISGFLMYPNYIRHGDPLKYTRQRARRILPPYLFIVLASAIGFGLISDLGLSGYFRSEGLWAYLGANISFLNWLHPDLPGVFQGDAYVNPAVNGSLWTMKVEWCLYFSVPLFIWIAGRLRRISPPWIALGVIILSIVYRQILTSLYDETGSEIYNILRRQIFGQLAFFYAGMLVYFIKDFFIRYSVPLLLAGAALKAIIPLTSYTAAIILEPIAVTSIVMALSLFPKDIRALRHRNNISYEIYLFHFPLIQLGIYLGLPSAGMAPMIIYSFAATVILSFAVHSGYERWLTSNKR